LTYEQHPLSIIDSLSEVRIANRRLFHQINRATEQPRQRGMKVEALMKLPHWALPLEFHQKIQIAGLAIEAFEAFAGRRAEQFQPPDAELSAKLLDRWLLGVE